AEPTTAVTEDATYGITFSDDMTTATVTIYNIKFAPQSPTMKAVILNNLTVTLGRHGYTVTGQDVIPEVPEGTTTTEYRNFPFKSFTLSTSNDLLTEASCAYIVEATIGERTMTFRGEFTGLCADYLRTESTEK
ncbi:MAG: hypothetical protein K2F87_02345, partial [Muribaculaceae bacterium]|nr:hypothetical protein [Muribaculaceae bacterium]